MPRPPAPEYTPPRSGPSMGLIGAVVALLVALIAVLVWMATRSDAPVSGASGHALKDGAGISVGAAADADVPHIQIYEDFQCPYCGDLERSIGAELAKREQAGSVRVTYTIMSFLDGKIGNDVSTRTANAALCADDAGIFTPFHQEAYAQQPKEGTDVPDATFLGYAKKAGLSGTALDTFGSCVQSQKHADYVKGMQTRANRDGVSSTPTMKVEGEKISDQEMLGLMQDPSTLDAVLKAHGAPADGAATTSGR